MSDDGPTRATVADPRLDAVEAAMRRYVDGRLLPGVSWAVMKDGELVDERAVGFADVEAGVPLARGHLFRAYSNTKLFTSCAVLMLHEDGALDLDEPVDRWVPQLADRRVLRPGAISLDDVEPARSPITVRQLLSHSSGLSYGLLDPGTLLFGAYTSRRILSAATPLSAMIDALAPLPLSFHPGASWEYSIATDVLGHLVEVVSGRRFDAFLRERLFEPLGLRDTGFFVPPADADRLCAHYAGADPADPMAPGLRRMDGPAYRDVFLKAMPRLGGGGGLVSSLPDTTALLRALLPGGAMPLSARTRAGMMRNQLPEGVWIRLGTAGEIRGKGYGLGGAVTVRPSSIDPPGSEDEFQWGGMGGTHWWIAPRQRLAAVVVTQRHLGFWHPFSFEFKRGVFAALG
jgi:CubicO group peptidase (beta-lactamase class C family)